MTDKEQESQTKDLYRILRILDTRTCSTLLALKGIFLVAAIVLISSSNEISKAKECDLEKVLVSLSVDYTSPCKYDAIKKKSTTLCNVGISFLVLNAVLFLLVLNFLWIPDDKKKIGILVALAVFAVAVVYLGLTIDFYIDVLDSKERKTDIQLFHKANLREIVAVEGNNKLAIVGIVSEKNYSQIKSSMITRLEKNYTSDNVSSGDAISNSWNKFFMENECCAIHQVQGTTNDFDSTPWCTTSGTCQATASQIPKTCCNYVTEDNYQSAPGTCHSSVNPGTYKSNCMIPIKKLSTINIEECQISLLLITLLTIWTSEIAEILIAVIWAVNICCLIRIKNNGRIDPQNLDDQNECQKNQVINFNSCFCTPIRNNTSETQCKFKNSNNASNELHSI